MPALCSSAAAGGLHPLPAPGTRPPGPPTPPAGEGRFPSTGPQMNASEDLAHLPLPIVAALAR